MIDRLLKSMVTVAMVMGLTLTAGVLLLRHHQTAFHDGVEAAGVLTGVEAVAGARTTRYVATYTFVTADGREYSVRDLQAERSPRPGGRVHTISYRPDDPAGARVVRTWTRSTAFLALVGITLTGAASACLLVSAGARVRRWAEAFPSAPDGPHGTLGPCRTRMRAARASISGGSSPRRYVSSTSMGCGS